MRDQRVEFWRRYPLDLGNCTCKRYRLFDGTKRRVGVCAAVLPAEHVRAPEGEAPRRYYAVVAPLVAVMMDAGNDRRVLRNGEKRRVVPLLRSNGAVPRLP